MRCARLDDFVTWHKSKEIPRFARNDGREALGRKKQETKEKMGGADF